MADEIKNKNVETYAEDMAKAIEDDKGGLIRKIIHQEEEHEIEKKKVSPEAQRNKIFVFVGGLLILVTSALLLYLFFKKDINTVEIEKQFTPLIYYDRSDFIEISGFNKEKIAQAVHKAVLDTAVKTGGVEGMYLVENKKVVGFKRFIELIKGSFVSKNPLDRSSYVEGHFLMGAVNSRIQLIIPSDGPVSAKASAGKDFFILLRVRSITDVFESMRVWENKLFLDLHEFFGVNLSSETEYLLTKDFENGVVANKNARILYDKDKGAVMMYIFADDNSIVITNTSPAAQEIILRLASNQVEK
ncbi:hypothetical protein A3A95_00085 [Candidatus Nomurabacteria bacterium RIFCSPLOWO2_01_FULL_39_18]|uniref:Uncharacterized protein n=1 Tax=Candidatus Nomurabacteria bacterium RIFCSPHIGHO2_01_FULL_40_20 TaxID=1801738 RepID=A0A1F6V2C9_9BACT|nr:MAG: hypothetical protein A2733_00725 [Candidatus Nomurabacteria bacterium RIFCSPHIGHO2_01_FULL_40_20]OGI89007.1 MAG: hypothetical protein A3A95_00085 [Candidatus Nomurabacteria bacterium RIFCSPLOWO2_01_FULL_39_18]